MITSAKSPVTVGAPGRTRTCDPRLRRPDVPRETSRNIAVEYALAQCAGTIKPVPRTILAEDFHNLGRLIPVYLCEVTRYLLEQFPMFSTARFRLYRSLGYSRLGALWFSL